MLKKIYISNYAIIDELEVGFSPRLNVITGETGAGKSIIIGALGLILGDRADSAVLVNKEKKCIVEAVFDEESKELRSFLTSHDLDVSEELVIRREIGINGKSRAFINDTPVTLQQLQELSLLLVDLHQQFDTLALTEHDFQREVLDALAGHLKLLDEYREVFMQWQVLKKETEELKAKKIQFEKEADYNRFQYSELEEADFRENELEETESELKLMNNAEGIKSALENIYAELRESESPLVPRLRSIVHQLNALASFHSGLPELIKRFESMQIELQDISSDLEKISSHIHYDPQRAEQLNQRLSLGYKLQKKHGLGSTAELLALQEEIGQKMQEVLEIDDAIHSKEKELGHSLEHGTSLAEKISAGRQKQVTAFENKVNKLLTQVGMPHARLKVVIRHTEMHQSGSDSVEFLFNANLPVGKTAQDANFQPLRKVASGGELSRLMLCIKSLVAQRIDLPSQIFDEIEAGISGEAARQVGIIMKDLSGKRQVICITHQPQVAGRADAHLFVYKQIIGDHIKTSVRLLNTEERITTIAKMLSGEKPTAAALENAREMIRN